MTAIKELSVLFHRDLTRLIQELQAFPDDETVWKTLPGISNSAGNLALHLEGNLREFIGRQLGGLPYERQRQREFGDTGIALASLIRGLEDVRTMVANVFDFLPPEKLEAIYPENVLGPALTTRQFIIHLQGHLNYHLGQVDYLRRILTGGTAVQFAGL